MEKVIHPRYNHEVLEVHVAGHSEPLYFSPNVHRCGDVKDGVAFNFGDHGAWVVPMDELREMVRLAEEVRAAVL